MSGGVDSSVAALLLRDAGHDVVGVDNLSKYGAVEKSYSRHPRYRLHEGDAKDVAFLRRMAQLGRGDFYLVANALSLPRYFRSEYQRKTGERIREGAFTPLVRSLSPVLRGLSARFRKQGDQALGLTRTEGARLPLENRGLGNDVGRASRPGHRE